MFRIDGSMGEGGGSVLRIAVAFSILFQEPVHIFNIRKNRSNPGLATQHLTGIKALQELSGSSIEGAKLGSTELTIYPGNNWKASASINIPTAGSIGLLTQQLQIASCKSGVKKLSINITGGATFGKWAPTEPYLRLITFRILDKMGYRIAINVQRHGFYPKGGARALLTIEPTEKLKPINLVERGEIKKILVESLASTHLKRKMVAERMVDGFVTALKQSLTDLKPTIETHYIDAASPGCGIAACCFTTTGVILGSDAIGELKVSAEKVGAKAAELLLGDINSLATSDRFASDQLIPFMALAGDSTIIVREITSHTKTNIELVSMFLGKGFDIKKLPDEKGYIIHVP